MREGVERGGREGGSEEGRGGEGEGGNSYACDLLAAYVYHGNNDTTAVNDIQLP